MRKALFLLLLHCIAFPDVRATRITGTVKDDKGNFLAYASILVKGSTRGVTANNEGKYFLDLAPGAYTLVCQYVGYAREEKKITVGQEYLTVDFRLSLQQLSMADVVVRPGGEDPAYDIIRHAIKKRKDYESPLDSFTCEAYIKTLIKSRKIPKRILGQKIEEKDKKDVQQIIVTRKGDKKDDKKDAELKMSRIEIPRPVAIVTRWDEWNRAALRAVRRDRATWALT